MGTSFRVENDSKGLPVRFFEEEHGAPIELRKIGTHDDGIGIFKPGEGDSREVSCSFSVSVVRQTKESIYLTIDEQKLYLVSEDSSPEDIENFLTDNSKGEL